MKYTVTCKFHVHIRIHQHTVVSKNVTQDFNERNPESPTALVVLQDTIEQTLTETIAIFMSMGLPETKCKIRMVVWFRPNIHNGKQKSGSWERRGMSTNNLKHSSLALFSPIIKDLLEDVWSEYVDANNLYEISEAEYAQAEAEHAQSEAEHAQNGWKEVVEALLGCGAYIFVPISFAFPPLGILIFILFLWAIGTDDVSLFYLLGIIFWGMGLVGALGFFYLVFIDI